MILGLKPQDSEFVDWQSILSLVFPAQAGIQVCFVDIAQAQIDAGLRRHDVVQTTDLFLDSPIRTVVS
jgi:hypothetical protein